MVTLLTFFYEANCGSETRQNNIPNQIITNMFNLYNFHIILPPIEKSDHHPVLCRPWPCSNGVHMLNKAKSIEINTRSMGHNERCLFVDALTKVDWSMLYNMPTCEEKSCYFYKTMSSLTDTFLPTKTITRVVNDKPWVTPQFKQLIQTRQCLWIASDEVNYNRYRNKVY